MTQFLQLVVSGLAMGCVLGLIALGFTLIYKGTETVNFAQGDLMMLGGFVALTAVAIDRFADLAGRAGTRKWESSTRMMTTAPTYSRARSRR
jgi:branched-subunit amino acid ABC-type transport system permease component